MTKLMVTGSPLYVQNWPLFTSLPLFSARLDASVIAAVMSAIAFCSFPVGVKPYLLAIRLYRDELGWPGTTAVYMGTPAPTMISSMIFLRFIRKFSAKRTFW